jgi:hypothetical protein
VQIDPEPGARLIIVAVLLVSNCIPKFPKKA